VKCSLKDVKSSLYDAKRSLNYVKCSLKRALKDLECSLKRALKVSYVPGRVPFNECPSIVSPISRNFETTRNAEIVDVSMNFSALNTNF
jgi:hypothetical protein